MQVPEEMPLQRNRPRAVSDDWKGVGRRLACVQRPVGGDRKAELGCDEGVV